MPYRNPYQFINIKPNSPPKEVKRKLKDLVYRYSPRTINKEDKVSAEKYEKLNEYIISLNNIKQNLKKEKFDIKKIKPEEKKNDFNFNQEYYNQYKDEFTETVYDYSKEELKVILKANNLETSESITKLITDVLENIPSEIAEINLWEFRERSKSLRIKFNKLSIQQTKRICQKLNLNTSGNKNDLINRILVEINKEELDSLIETIEKEERIRQKLVWLNENKLKRILELKSLKTNGNKNDLIERILLNLDEDEIDYLIDTIEKEEKIKGNLKELKEYMLKRILELKSLKTNGNKNDLIIRIISSIDTDEIDSLIKKVNQEYETYELELKKFRINQLNLILNNKNITIFESQDQIIERIFENISLNDLDDKISKVEIYKEKALEKLYGIIGETKLNDEFIETLNGYGIKESQFNIIKNELVNLINDYQISEKEVERELNKRLKKKSEEIEEEALNKLYNIVGKTRLNPSFISKLKSRGLDKSVGEQIKKEIEEDIKAKKVSKEDINSLINSKIEEAETEDENEKLSILYKYIGENEINEVFKSRLEKNNLDEEFWLKLKSEMTTLIKEKSIKNDSIIPKVNELLDLEIANNLLLENELSTLNQLAILKDFEIADNKDKQIDIILSHLSERFNPTTIKDYIKKILDVKESLNKLFQTQLEDILEKNDLEIMGEKEEQIDRILSNIHLRLISLHAERHEEIKKELEESPLNYLFFILKENNLKVKGAKTKVINEIIKNISLDKIDEDFDSIDKKISKLRQLHDNELIYIAETNNIYINKEDSLIDQIKGKIDLYNIESILTEIRQIKEIVYSFNEIQRKHLLILSNLEVPESEEDQINSILLKSNINDIIDLDKKIKAVEEELNTLDVDQLNYILERNNKEPIYSKDKQIDYILNNFLIEDIENSIFNIKDILIQLNQLNDYQLNTILQINNIKSSNRDANILKIYNDVPLDVLKNNIAYVKSLNKKETIPDEIKDSIFYSPIKKKEGKYSLTTVRKNNLNLIPIFDYQENLKDFIRKKFSETSDIESIKKEFNYFKKLISYNNKIDGLIIFRNQKYIIIRKEDL